MRTALVTGASSGIGASIARRLADDGVRGGLLYRTLAGLFTHLPRPLVRHLIGNAWKPGLAEPGA